MGIRTIHLYLYPDRSTLAVRSPEPLQFDDLFEPSGYTDNRSVIHIAERPFPIHNWPIIGTIKLVQHELGHIFLNGGNSKHHKFLECDLLGLCVMANHSFRAFDGHSGNATSQLAWALLMAARAAPPDKDGIRHASIEVSEELIAAA